ncbi:MAG: hypothetical protein ACOYNC_08775 [Bacteroidales bacterium]
MKKLVLFTMAMIFVGMACTFAQDKEANSPKGKLGQADLANNFYVSYGIGTIYYFIDNENLTANSFSGTFLLGYARSMNKVVSVGFQLSYTNIGRSGNSDYYYSSQSTYRETMTDNLWQGIANVRFHYVNKPSFSMYSGIGLGVTMDFYKKTINSGSIQSNEVINGQKIFPAGQMTLLGFRVGRALSFFGEFGIGTNSILNAGVSYKFGDN